MDSLRIAPPFPGGVPGFNRSGYFAERNAQKRSVTIDLKSAEGIELIKQLVVGADIVANNFRPGVMEGLGLGYDEVSILNPSVIYLSMSMAGAVGPESAYLGYGVTIAAVAGMTALSGEPGRYPVGTGTHFPDHVPNPGSAAFAALAALRHRRRTGQGQSIEIAQTEPTIAFVGPAIMAWTANGVDLPMQGNRDERWVPHGVFRAAGDDRWIAIVARDDTEWRALAGVLGLDAERWPTEDDRAAHPSAVEAAVAAATAAHEPRELSERLQAAGVPAGLVSTSKDLLEDDPQLRARTHWRSLEHAEMGRTTYGAAPIRLSETPGTLDHAAPLLGEHTREVLSGELGLSDAELDRLEKEGVLK